MPFTPFQLTKEGMPMTDREHINTPAEEIRLKRCFTRRIEFRDGGEDKIIIHYFLEKCNICEKSLHAPVPIHI